MLKHARYLHEKEVHALAFNNLCVQLPFHKEHRDLRASLIFHTKKDMCDRMSVTIYMLGRNLERSKERVSMKLDIHHFR